MKPGEPFNPWREACGFYAPDIIGRRQDLKDGPKRLYERLVRFAGRDARCFPAQQTLADELGKSVAQIKRDLKTLEKICLITHEFRNGRRSNTYNFLWHAWFDGSQMSHQEQSVNPLHGSPVSRRRKRSGGPEGSNVSPQPSVDRSSISTNDPSREFVDDDLRAHPRPMNSVHEFYTGKSSSSSSPSSGHSKTTQTTMAPLADERRKSPTERWWTPGDFTAAGALLRASQGMFSRLASPDPGLVAAILPCMTSIEDMKLWLASSQSLLQSAKTWGRYVTDAQQWARRRADTLEQLNRSTKEPHHAETRDQERQRPPTPAHCHRCGHDGVRQAEGDAELWEWCDCANAQRRWERSPDYVERKNAIVLERRRSFEASKKTSAA